MTSSRVYALVCDDSLNGLGIVRSLRDQDAVVVALVRKGSVVGASKLIDRTIEYRDGDDVEKLISAFLSEVAPSLVIPFPGSDNMLGSLARIADAHPNLSFPDSAESVENFFSKAAQYRLAERAGLAVPEWKMIEAPDEVEESWDFPVVVRPVDRTENLGTRAPVKAQFCDDLNELVSTVSLLKSAGFNSLVSEMVHGPEENLFTYGGYAFRGEVVAEFIGRKLWHTYPTRVVAVAESVDDPEVASYGRRYVAATGLSGIFQVEVKRDARSGELFLIEMNQRNWLWGQLASACGTNLPAIKLANESREVGGTFDLAIVSNVARTEGIFVNEYGVLSNIWGYKSTQPLRFVARRLVARDSRLTFALGSVRDPRPVGAGVLSALKR